MKSQELTYKAIYAKLAKRTEKYAADVRNVFLNGMGEIAKLCEGIEIPDGEVFHFNDYPEIATQVQERLRSMYSELYQCVRGDIVREWYYANDDVDRLVKAMFGKQAAEQPHYAKYFQRNKQAMDAFFERQQQGLSISQRVWKYIGEGKEELELALDLGLGAGKDADELSREVRHLLQNPDNLFRRVRNKHGELVLSKAAKAYHPGQGVYRSSYKNAMRLTRTETNMAYRTADITRWQQLPFVVGYEVKISKKHPYPDICDELAGKYPKGFIFKGWHPHCYCYIVPILCTDKEMEELTGRILEGTETEFTPAGVVQDVPAAFTSWIEQNAERIESASSLPYFIRDNYPKGDISKAGNWVKAGIANEPSIGSFAQVVAKQEVDLQMFSKVQPYTNEAWQGMSNFVPADAEELELLLGKSTAGFDSMYVANDATTYAELLEWAKKGYAEPWQGWVDKTMLDEIKAVTYKAKFASKQDGRFIASMERSMFEGCISSAGKEVQLQGVSKWGTNYSKAAGKAIAAEEEQVLVVVKTPAGSRYVQTMAGEEQQAVFMPNTKYKVVGKVEKTVIQQGKASKVLQYELELVEDGSTMAEELLIKQAEVQSELAKHTKAVKVANNVVKAARNGKYEMLGIDADELEEMLGEGVATSAEIKAKTQQIAKEMAAAKKAALLEAKEKPNLWQLTQEFGEADANGFMANWQKHMAKSSIYTDDATFLKKVIDKELYYAGLNPNKYATTPKFIEYMQKLKVQYEAKIQLAAVQGDINSVVTFASTCKPNAKIHTMVNELLHAVGSTTPDITAIQSKLAEAQKEMQRLTKERLKLLKKKGAGGYNIEKFYSTADNAKLQQLQAEYETALKAAGGNERDWAVRDAMQKLADYTSMLGEKYAAMQPTLDNVDGLTEAEVQKLIKKYFTRTPINPKVPSEPYGIWGDAHGGERWWNKEAACKALAKEIASFGGSITAQELSTITDFTHSSNWICDYLYGASKVSLITDKAIKADVEAMLNEFKATINHAIESMPRYNGITYRGLNIYPEAIADPTKDGFWNSIMQAWNSKDKVWSMVSPTSTTTSISTADRFADGIVHVSKGQRIIMKIHGKTGVDIHKVGYFGSGESEITFRAGSKFRMLKAPYQCKKAGLGKVGDWVVEIEEIFD